MKRLALLMGGLVAGLLVAAVPARAEPPLVIATGEVTGFYFPVGGALCRLLGREAEKNGLRCLVEPTSGNVANLALLKQGKTDLAILQSRVLQQARSGEGAFAEQGAFAGLRAVAALHGEPLVVLTAKSAKIRLLADLKGKRVNLGRPQSFQRLMAESILEAAGLATADLAAVREIDLDEQAAALCDGRTDVAFFTGIHPMAAVQRALSDCDAQALDLTSEVIQKAMAREPFLSAYVLPADTYPAIGRDISTIAMKAVLATTESLPAATAEKVARTLADGFTAFAELHPVLRGTRRDGLAKDGIAVPLHSGAEKFYREAGLLK